MLEAVEVVPVPRPPTTGIVVGHLETGIEGRERDRGGGGGMVDDTLHVRIDLTEQLHHHTLYVQRYMYVQRCVERCIHLWCIDYYTYACTCTNSVLP